MILFLIKFIIILVQYGNIIQEQANQLLEDYESTFLIPIDYTNILKKLWLESKAIQTAIDREHEINLSMFFFYLYKIFLFFHLFDQKKKKRKKNTY